MAIAGELREESPEAVRILKQMAAGVLIPVQRQITPEGTGLHSLLNFYTHNHQKPGLLLLVYAVDFIN